MQNPYQNFIIKNISYKYIQDKNFPWDLGSFKWIASSAPE